MRSTLKLLVRDVIAQIGTLINVIRLVLDTNIVVSAMLRSGGLPEAVFNIALAGQASLFASSPILAEYEEVLRRARLGINAEKVTRALAHIRAAALILAPTERVTAALDPDDNIFLECAQAAGADYLVTGNIKHYPSRWFTTLIVTPRQFVEEWAARSE